MLNQLGRIAVTGLVLGGTYYIGEKTYKALKISENKVCQWTAGQIKKITKRFHDQSKWASEEDK